MTTGRNDLCPCGSGKKFKKCCNLIPKRAVRRDSDSQPNVSAIAEPLATLAPNETTVSIPFMGFPGQRQAVTVVNEFADQRPSHLAGSTGEYKVVFVLSRPGRTPRSDRDLSFKLGSEGDSHLSLTAAHLLPAGTEGKGVIAMHIDHKHNGRQIRLIGRPNDRGFIASIEATLTANSFVEAEVDASKALAPALSTWSATLNIPLLIQQIEITETRTGNERVSATMPFHDAPAGLVSQEGLSEDFLWFAALYREGLNSNSPLYRFLCIYKIIEGIVVRRGATRPRPKVDERIPSNPAEFNEWLHAIFPVRPEQWDDMAIQSIFIAEVVGRSVGEVRENHLRPLRNDIGHLLSDDAGNGPKARLWIDDPLQTLKVDHWLPIATCVARLMLKNEFPKMFLPHLDERGRVRP